MDLAKDIDKPFRVVTEVGGVFCSGHDIMENAMHHADHCNEQARELGIKTRYVATDKDSDVVVKEQSAN